MSFDTRFMAHDFGHSKINSVTGEV